MQSVQKGTAAAKAGIRGGTVSTDTEDGQVAVGGDIIVAIDGKAVTSSEELANDIERRSPATRSRSNCWRANGQRQATNTRPSPRRSAQRPNSVPTRTRPKARSRSGDGRAPATVGACRRLAATQQATAATRRARAPRHAGRRART